MKKNLLFITLLTSLLAIGCSKSGGGSNPGGGGDDPKPTEYEASFTLNSADAVSKLGINVSFDKASGQNVPAWYDAGLRLYANNQVHVSSNNEIRKIEFDWEKQGKKDFATLTVDVGEYTHPTGPGVGTWTGEENEIIFTLGTSGQLQLNTFKVTAYGIPEEDPDDPTGNYTAYTVMCDIGNYMWDDFNASDDLTGPDSDGLVYSNYFADFGSATGEGEQYLNDALTEIAEDVNFPTYLSVLEGPTFEAESYPIDDTTYIDASYIYFITDDEEVVLLLISMVDEGDLVIAFEAAPTEYYTR